MVRTRASLGLRREVVGGWSGAGWLVGWKVGGRARSE